jgi:hypothetical protein
MKQIEQYQTVVAMIDEAIRRGFLHPYKDGSFDRTELERWVSTLEPIKSDE